MDFNRIKQAQKESGTVLDDSKMERFKDRQRAQIVAPTVTRRPVLDSMLADISIIASMTLQRMRQKVQGGEWLDQDEMREFRNLCESVIRQTRVEMEVENHVQARTSALSNDQIREKLIRALTQEGIDVRVQGIVLKALGMQP